MSGLAYGTVVLRMVSGPETEERVVSYLCRVFKNLSFDRIEALLRLPKPVALFEDIPEDVGHRIAADLNRMGACAFFLTVPIRRAPSPRE